MGMVLSNGMPQDLTERQKTILDAVVREYVATAEPVASGDLVEQYNLPFSPATVRSELLALDGAGYVGQPHTSAGRVPTDKGYRYFINHAMPAAPAGARADHDGVRGREERMLRPLRGLTDPVDFIRQASRLMAECTHTLALAGFPDEDMFYKSGASEVLQEPEFSDRSLMHQFNALVEVIEDELMAEFKPSELGEPRIFIGSENPIREARRYGMVVSSYETPFNRESVVCLIGPKRMDYAHNVALLKHLRELLET